jgi:hypothetical protein
MILTWPFRTVRKIVSIGKNNNLGKLEKSVSPFIGDSNI